MPNQVIGTKSPWPIPISHMIIPQAKTSTLKNSVANPKLFISPLQLCIVTTTLTYKYSKPPVKSHTTLKFPTTEISDKFVGNTS